MMNINSEEREGGTGTESDSSKESGSSLERYHEFSPDGVRRIRVKYDLSVIQKKKAEWKKFISNLKPYPKIYNGRGIVICAGGLSYFTCAWVNIQLLRKNGCDLPIEIWHQEGELDTEVIAELKKLNVTCRKFNDYIYKKISNGYQLKPVAILNSSFKEVLFLDADNNCLEDPAPLFEDDFYQKYGAVFWPDYWKTEESNPIWQIIESTEFSIPEQESGQLLINKEKCWKELNLCLFFNLDPFYYKILWGDKDTFKFSWLALKSPFQMVKKKVSALGFQDEEIGFGAIAMVQHDFSGEPLFIHSNLLKWNERTSKDLFWREIRTVRTERKIEMKYHPHFRKYFVSIKGKRQIISGENAIAALESQCLKELEVLRNSRFYKNLVASET